jgi:hypothetical protein
MSASVPGYDRALSSAKQAATEMLCNLLGKESRFTLHDMAGCIDRLNEAWDELTDHLVRQRDARDETIAHLHNQIAHLKKGRP